MAMESEVVREPATCDGCRRTIPDGETFFMCDEVMGVYCADPCWPNTPCGKGEHGEGCATMVC